MSFSDPFTPRHFSREPRPPLYSSVMILAASNRNSKGDLNKYVFIFVHNLDSRGRQLLAFVQQLRSGLLSRQFSYLFLPLVVSWSPQLWQQILFQGCNKSRGSGEGGRVRRWEQSHLSLFQKNKSFLSTSPADSGLGLIGQNCVTYQSQAQKMLGK